MKILVIVSNGILRKDVEDLDVPSPRSVLHNKRAEDGTHTQAGEECKNIHGCEETLRQACIPDVADDAGGNVRQCRCA